MMVPDERMVWERRRGFGEKTMSIVEPFLLIIEPPERIFDGGIRRREIVGGESQPQGIVQFVWFTQARCKIVGGDHILGVELQGPTVVRIRLSDLYLRSQQHAQSRVDIRIRVILCEGS